MNALDWIAFALYLAAGLVIALVVHEAAHALAADRLGDHTPKQQGRLTLNPKPHVDRFGTLVLPGILLLPVFFGEQIWPIFAYAKPQPLSPWTSRRGRDSILIAAAGPVANIVLAFAYGALLRTSGSQGHVSLVLFAGLHTTVVLAVMNLVPLPGLDASRVLSRVLPVRAREIYINLEQYLALFVLVVFFIFAGPIIRFVSAVGNGICRLVAGTECVLP
jgi:Zn-dependent protease